MTLGTRLRQCRERKRFSQKEVAEHIGISQTTYCNWENDTASYQVKYLPLLAQLFEVSVPELVLEVSGTKASNDYSQQKGQDTSDRIVDVNQVYADLLRSKEEIIQLLKEENRHLKKLIEIGVASE